jgi:ABC-2 type transport system ATP-binding protein
MASAILEVRDLVKKFKDFTAVGGVSFEIREGVCFGLLGPNGAGKTTTLEVVEGIGEATSGQVFWRGKPAGKEFRERIGIQFQSTALPDKLRVGEVLDLFASFYPKTLPRDEIIQWCDLGELLKKDANTLSGGQKQRLLLGIALVNDPDLVFLDEPTTGLDPYARRRFWELIRSVKSRGKTIVLTTHYMEEAYELCDEIAIMDKGKIIAQGSPDRLLKEHFQGLSLRIPREDAAGGFKDIPGARVFEREDTFEIQTDSVNDSVRYLLDKGVPLARLQIRSRNLEDLFLKLTGKGFAEEAKP